MEQLSLTFEQTVAIPTVPPARTWDTKPRDERILGFIREYKKKHGSIAGVTFMYGDFTVRIEGDRYMGLKLV